MSRRHRRHDRHYEYDMGRRMRHYGRRRKAGWGMNLYRNNRDSMIAGVASGLADHWDVAPWVVRLLWVGAFLFTGTLAIWGYVACWILMARRPSRPRADGEPGEELDYADADVEMEYVERHHDYRPRKVFRYSEPSNVRLQRARERLDAALARVEDMESYVTSRQYELNKEFSRL